MRSGQKVGAHRPRVLNSGRAASVASGMTRVEQVVRRAQARRLLRRVVALLGPALAIGAAAALLGALTDRLIGPGIAWWIWLAAPIGLAAAIAVVIAALGRGGPLDAAVEIDTVLRLRDRLGTALALRGAASEDAFAALAVEDAERAAGEVRVERAVPIRFGNSWVAWPALALVAGVVGFFVPSLDLLGANEANASPANDPKRLALAEQLGKIAEEIEPEPVPLPEDAKVADLGSKHDEVLDALSKQLLEGSKSADEARADAVEHLNQTAEELAREAERRALKEQAARELFNSLSGKNAQDSQSAADALLERLASGDLAGAAEAARNLEQQLDQMSEAERRAVAEHLEKSAQELEEAAAEAERRAAEQAEADREPLEQQGVPPEDAADLQNETDPDAIRQALEEKGVDPETAERLAQEAARRNAERQAKEEAAKEARESAEDMRDLLPDLRKPPPQKTGQPDDQPPDERETTSEPSRQPRDPFEPLTPPKAPKVGDKDPTKRDQQKGSEEGKRPEQRGAEQPAGSPDQNKGSQPSPPGEQQSSGGEQGQEQQEGQQGQQQGAQGGEKSNSPAGLRKGDGSQPTDRQDPNAPQRPGDSPSESTGQSPSDSSSSGGGAGSGERGQPQGSDELRPGLGGRPSDAQRDTLSERFNDLAREAQEAEAARKRAERLRDAARRLADGAPPEQRDGTSDQIANRSRAKGGSGGDGSDDSERLAGPGSRPRVPDGFRGTDDVDARRGGEDGRVVHEWSNPDAPISRDGAVSNRPMSEELLEAQESAQKGVEERTIPSRYDPVLRKYFEKALRRAKEAEAEQKKSEPAPAAKDAGK